MALCRGSVAQQGKEIGRIDNIQDDAKFVDCASKRCEIIAVAFEKRVEIFQFKDNKGTPQTLLTIPFGSTLCKLGHFGDFIIYKDLADRCKCRVFNIINNKPVAILSHLDEILSISVSEERVVTSSHDKFAKIWNAYNGSCLRAIEHQTSVIAANVSKNFTVTAANDTIVRLYGNEFVAPIGQITEHTDRITSLVARERSPSCCVIFSGGWDATVRVSTWFGNQVQSTHVITLPNIAYDLAVSADGRLLLTGACDYVTRLYHIENDKSKLLTRLTGSRNQIECVSLSADGTVSCVCPTLTSVKRYDLFAMEREKLVAFVFGVSRSNHDVVCPLPDDVLKIIRKMLFF